MSEAPEDWPASVTAPGLLPNEAMFFWMKAV